MWHLSNTERVRCPVTFVATRSAILLFTMLRTAVRRKSWRNRHDASELALPRANPLELRAELRLEIGRQVDDAAIIVLRSTCVEPQC
jgi:hypothetical protein